MANVNLNNFCQATGRLVRDPKVFPEHRDGSKAAVFTLAVPDTYTDANGERVVDYLDFDVFIPKPAADGTKSYMARMIELISKGTQVRVTYRRKNNHYIDKNDVEQYGDKNKVDEIFIYDSRAVRDARKAAAAAAVVDEPEAAEETEKKPF